ncbi:MAG: NYN domain-containing protein [SAR324 cluster bacterium]|nr:NYN domain-containing protein [SAR324 cluster bacterium]
MRAIAFIDGQNLFFSVKAMFGYSHPNYDILALSKAICEEEEWELTEVRFYTGIPHKSDIPKWHDFWVRKLRSARMQGVVVYKRDIRKRIGNVDVVLSKLFSDREWHQNIENRPESVSYEYPVYAEKGIDVRLAIDSIRLAMKNEYDVAVFLSQDQDLSEAVKEIKLIGCEQNRQIIIACAFPKSETVSEQTSSDTVRGVRGNNGTKWIPFDKDLYDHCIDIRDYRSKE